MQIGFPMALGIAMAKKIKKEEGNIYCLMSDGEQDGGMIWESALISSHPKLNNLVAIIDNNLFQAMGVKNDILKIEPLKEKWEAFGWYVLEVDGHDFSEIKGALERKTLKPKCIIFKTIKGYPVNFMEGNNLYHYKNLTVQQYIQAQHELNQTK